MTTRERTNNEQQNTKQSIENQRSNNTNPTKIWRWTQVLRMVSYKSGNMSWLRKGRDVLTTHGAYEICSHGDGTRSPDSSNHSVVIFRLCHNYYEKHYINPFYSRFHVSIVISTYYKENLTFLKKIYHL